MVSGQDKQEQTKGDFVMELWKDNKMERNEAFRLQAIELISQLRLFRKDVDVDLQKVIEDAKRIEAYLKEGV